MQVNRSVYDLSLDATFSVVGQFLYGRLMAQNLQHTLGLMSLIMFGASIMKSGQSLS